MRETEENSFFRLEPEIKDDDSNIDAIQFGLAAITMIVATLFVFALVK